MIHLVSEIDPALSRNSLLMNNSNHLLIPLVTLPVLTLWVGLRRASKLAIEAGQWSEELFRGDRLPNIDFDQPNP